MIVKRYRSKSFEAYQFTKAMVEALYFDDVPLPPEIRCVSASYHQGNRKLYQYTVRFLSNGERVQDGDWIIRQRDGGSRKLTNADFEAEYEEDDQRTP